MRLAQEKNAKIIGFSGFDGGAMKEMANACLVVPVDTDPYGTPAIEAFHVVLFHAIIFDLKERIKNA
jgi:phosphoheptose isomerase